MKGKTKWLILLLLLLLGLSGCQGKVESFDGQRAWVHLEHLSSDEFAGRLPGTEGNEQAAAYIEEQYRAYGLQPISDTDGYFQTFSCISPTWTGMPQFALIDADGQPVYNLEWRREYMASTSGIAGGGRAEGELSVFRSLEEIETPILLLTDPEWLTEDRAREVKESGVQAVIRPVKTALRGPQQDLILKSVSLGNKGSVEDGLIILTVTREAMEKLIQMEGLEAKIQIPLEFPRVQAKNVIGIVPGTDSELKNEVMLISAHFDHVGLDPDGAVYPGALDNASGVSVLLELARVLAESKPERTLVFAAWNAEESGLLGSAHFVRNADSTLFPMEHTRVINLDMIGSAEPVPLTLSTDFSFEDQVNGAWNNHEWIDALGQAAREAGLAVELNTHSRSSDHFSFVRFGVPAVTAAHMATGNIHTPADTLVNCDPERLNRAGSGLEQMLRTLAMESQVFSGTGVGITAEWFGGSLIIAVFIAVGSLLLLWRRKSRRARGQSVWLEGKPVVAILLSILVVFSLIMVSSSRTKEELPASLLLKPWNRIVEVKRDEADFSSVLKPMLADDGAWVERVDEQGRRHQVLVKSDREGNLTLNYRWAGAEQAFGESVALAAVATGEEIGFVMDQAYGMVFRIQDGRLVTGAFPLGTSRSGSYHEEDLVIHHESGARMELTQFSLAETAGRGSIRLAVSGTIGSGESLIELLTFQQGKLDGKTRLYMADETSVEQLGAYWAGEYLNVTWQETGETRSKTVSSDPLFGYSPLRVNGIMRITYLIQGLIRGFFVLLTRLYCIFPGILLLLYGFVRKNKAELKNRWWLLAVLLSFLLQIFTFGMPVLFGFPAERLLISILLWAVSFGVAWADRIERGKPWKWTSFVAVMLLNVFFLSLFYGSPLFERGLARQNQDFGEGRPYAQIESFQE